MSRKLQSGKRPRRFLSNEGDLANFLRKKTNWDVQVVSMQKLDFQAQAQLIYQTNVLISVHTGGFYNLLFMHKGSVALQLNVPGTHFGTYEYENRPQLPFWRRGMWHLNFQRICNQRQIIFLEDWANADFRHAENFVGYSRFDSEKQHLLYENWASTSLFEIEEKWKYCHKVQDAPICESNIANEMRAHSTADELFWDEEKLWRIISPYAECIHSGYCSSVK